MQLIIDDFNVKLIKFKINYMRALFMLTFFCVSFCFSQSSNWWVFFTDKDCPQVIALSDRAIDRRVKVSQILKNKQKARIRGRPF